MPEVESRLSWLLECVHAHRIQAEEVVLDRTSSESASLRGLGVSATMCIAER
jgi:hypothetical protein